MNRELSSRDWFGKASAGAVMGFLIALGASGLFKLAMGLADTFFSTKGQFSMWMISPIWALILSFSFLFVSPRSAWGWLGLAAGVLWAPLFVLGGTA